MAELINLSGQDTWLLSVLARLPEAKKRPEVYERYLSQLSTAEARDIGLAVVGAGQDLAANVRQTAEALIAWANRNRQPRRTRPVARRFKRDLASREALQQIE
jgi:hypothetical protein